MKYAAIISMFFVLYFPTAAEPFSIDVEWDELRRLNGKSIVADLRVGETGLVNASDVCEENDQLHIYRATELKDYSEYGTYYNLTRFPENKVRLEIALPLEQEHRFTPEQQHALRMATARRQFIENPILPDCSLFAQFTGANEGSLDDELTYVVETINEVKSLSELLEGIW